QLRAGRQQRIGECAFARTDLHKWLAGTRVDGGDNAPQDAGIVQEMLPEALARDVGVAAHAWRRAARSSARRAAAKALPASARPWPARSSATPWSTEVRTNGRPRLTLTAAPKPRAFSTGRPWSWYMAR